MYANKFIEDLRKEGKTENTIKTYLNGLKRFEQWFIDTNNEDFIPQNITPIDVKEFKSYLIRQKAKPSTINTFIIVIRKFCEWAKEQGLIEDNPATHVKHVKQARPAPKWLDRKEQLRLLREVQKDNNPRNMALVMLMMGAGLRVEEVASLTIDDVILNERKAAVVVRDGKGGKWRQVPLNNDVRKAVAAWLDVRQSDHEALFVSGRGPLSIRAIQYAIETYARKVRIEHLTCHALRHTFGHNLASAGVPLDQIAVLMGHMTADGRPNIATTVIYTTPGERDLRMAVGAVSWE